MRKFILTFLLACGVTVAAAQDVTSLLGRTSWRLNLASPSLGLERGLGRQSSLYVEAGLFTLPVDGQGSDYWLTTDYVDYKLRFDYRYYYRPDVNPARIFHGNYLFATLQARALSSRDFDQRSLVAGLGWGMQRSIGRYGFFDTQVGLGGMYEISEPLRNGTDGLQLPTTYTWQAVPLLRLGVGLRLDR